MLRLEAGRRPPQRSKPTPARMVWLQSRSPDAAGAAARQGVPASGIYLRRTCPGEVPRHVMMSTMNAQLVVRVMAHGRHHAENRKHRKQRVAAGMTRLTRIRNVGSPPAPKTPGSL